MAVAEDLHSALTGVSAALRSQGTEDTATLAGEAASILAGVIADGDAEIADDAAVRLADCLFRGSAAAGAVQSMMPAVAAARTAAERAPRVPAKDPGNPSKETA